MNVVSEVSCTYKIGNFMLCEVYLIKKRPPGKDLKKVRERVLFFFFLILIFLDSIRKIILLLEISGGPHLLGLPTMQDQCYMTLQSWPGLK